MLVVHMGLVTASLQVDTVQLDIYSFALQHKGACKEIVTKPI